MIDKGPILAIPPKSLGDKHFASEFNKFRMFLLTLADHVNAIPNSNESIKNNSQFTGVQNSINKVFTLPDDFISNSTRVYVNGIRQKIGVGNDYVENNNTIVFALPPDSTDNLIIDYIKE